MKKGCLIVFVVLCVVGALGIWGATSETMERASALATARDSAPPIDTAITQRARRDLAALSREIDAVQGDTTYRDPRASKFVNTRTAIGVYLVTAGGTLHPRMAITYVADDWLFVRSLTVRTDSALYELQPDQYGPNAIERDNGDGKIWEWWDVSADAHRAMLSDIAKSAKVVVRFNGKQYHKDWQVPETDKRAIVRVLSASLAR